MSMPPLAEPSPAEQVNMTCFQLSSTLGTLQWTVEEAAPLARHLLRIAGRVVIDTAAPGAEPAAWEGTRTQVLQWLVQALEPLGYTVTPLPGSGTPPVPDPSDDW